MARGGHSPAPTIPKASFTKVEDDASTQPAGVHDQQARSYGFNDFSNFQRPEHYIRYIEPLESELAVQVEYDMDEQDQEWLDSINNERKREQLDKVTYETFEVIMDRLEKEWFNLTKNIPKPDMALPSEDSTCAICDDAEGENINAIVFCDGCNLAVHQDCYGVPYIPEGQWLCRKCTVSPENPVSCILCPNEGGAFKQTVTGEWVHLLCAIWVPETRVANDVFMEPVTGVDKINKQRWKLKCSLCSIREGACIQCSKASCFLAFHTTCARREKLLMPMKSAHGSEPATLACYCEKHLPPEQLAAHEAALAELSESQQHMSFESDDGPGGALNRVHSSRSSKAARAYAKMYVPGAPLVPAIVVRHVLEYIGRISIRKKPEFVHLVCRYWSLKREARRGAPLLKRLHLEPWTSNTTLKAQSDEESAIKLEYLKNLRKDLEAVRMLAELVRKREAQKLKQIQAIHDTISTVFFQHSAHLRLAFERIVALDRHDFFNNPVSKADVPDYFDIIKRPMCWKMIDVKLDANRYWNIKDFRDDINLVLDNARMYNKPDTQIYKAAGKIKIASAHILDEIEQLARYISSKSPEAGVVGDLEPPLSALELLCSIDSIDSDMPLQLTEEPLRSLFSFELAKRKPRSHITRKTQRPQRDRKAEAERRRLRMLDHAAGFRAPGAPRTRRADAQLEAEERTIAMGDARGGEPVSVLLPVLFTGSAGAEEEEHEAVSTGSAGSRKQARSGTKIRRPHVLPGQTNVPPVVDDVDSHRSFSMFDAGWILPSNTRRGGRPPIERHELPPPRKKARTERQHSTLSHSTPATENQTLRHGSPLQTSSSYVGETSHEQKREESEPIDLKVPEVPGVASSENAFVPFMDALLIEDRLSLTSPQLEMSGMEKELDIFALAELPQEPEWRKSPRPRTKIIETLDTPATRREKRQRKKEQKLMLLDTGAAVSAESAAVLSTTSGHQQSSAVLCVHEDESGSELTALSDEGDYREEKDEFWRSDLSQGVSAQSMEDGSDSGRIVVAAEDARRAAAAAGLGPATILLKDGDVLEGGTLVWAKAETYPWWPAVVFEEDDPDVPPAVIREKKKSPRPSGGPFLLVQFWDARRTWQWLPTDKVRLLNEDKDWDAMMLDGNPKMQRFKTTKVREQCREAWRSAMSEMETSNVGSEASDQEEPANNEEVADAEVVVPLKEAVEGALDKNDNNNSG